MKWSFDGYFRSCCLCRRPSGGEALCPSCTREAISHMGPFLTSEQFVTFAMFLWEDRQNHFVEQLVLSLKANKDPSLLASLTGHLLAKDSANILRQQLDGALLVAAPSQDGGEDHASSLAKSLSEYIPIGVAPRIFKRRKGSPANKSLRKRERLSLTKLEIADEAGFEGVQKAIRKGQKVVLVDDVMTTGATAREVYALLGEPKYFSAFVLAYRVLAGDGWA